MLLERLKSSALFRGFAITTVGSGISKVILILTTFYCTNTLSQLEFGSYSFIRNTLNMVMCICALDYMGLCTKFTSEAKVSDTGKKRLFLLFSFSFLLCLFGGLALILLPDSVLLLVIGSENLISYFRIMGVIFPVFMLQPLIEGVFCGLKDFKIISILQIISSISFFAFVAGGITINGVSGAIYGMFIYYFLYSVMSVVAFSRRVHHDWSRVFITKSAKDELAIFPRLVFPVFLLSFVAAPLNWWAQVLLVKADSLVAVGRMTAVLQIRNIIVLVPSYFFSTFLAFAASLNAEKQYDEYFRQYQKFIIPLLIVGFLSVLFLSLFGKPVLGLYGSEYKSETLALLVSNLSIPFLLVGNYLKGSLTILEHQRMMLIITVVSSLLFIGSLYILLRTELYSVVAYFISQLIQCIFVFIMVLLVFSHDKRELYGKKA